MMTYVLGQSLSEEIMALYVQGREDGGHWRNRIRWQLYLRAYVPCQMHVSIHEACGLRAAVSNCHLRLHFPTHGNVSDCGWQDSQGKKKRKCLVWPSCELMIGVEFEEVRRDDFIACAHCVFISPSRRKCSVQGCSVMVTGGGLQRAAPESSRRMLLLSLCERINWGELEGLESNRLFSAQLF